MTEVEKTTPSPARIVVPATSMSSVAIRSSPSAIDSIRISSSTAFGISAGSARNSASRSGCWRRV